MTDQEFYKHYNELLKTDRDRAEQIWSIWRDDQDRKDYGRDWTQYLALTDKTPKGLIELDNTKVRVPATEAFHVSEDGLRQLIDPNSKRNWTTLPTDVLLKAAMAGGYVKDIPANSPEWKKKEQRQQFSSFLKMLGDASTDQGARNALAEYENLTLSKDPLGRVQKFINDNLFRTFSKRAKEDVLKREGPISFFGPGGMNKGDWGALGGDIGTGAALGAGATSAGRVLAGSGLASYGTELGSMAGAGALAGAGNVLNRAINTDEGVRPYEWITEPALDASLNTIAAPAFLRGSVREAGRFLKSAKIGGQQGVNTRAMLNRVGDYLENLGGWDEPHLNSTLKMLEEKSTNNSIKDSPLTQEVRDKIDNLFAKYNEGLVDEPGMSGSLFDRLQRLYEESGVETTPITSVHPETYVMEGVAAPSSSRFLSRLDGAINDLEQNVKNEGATQAGVEAKKVLDYFKNFREMAGAGLVDPHKLLANTDPVKQHSPTYLNRYKFQPGTAKKEPYSLNDASLRTDIDFMQDYVDAVKQGRVLKLNGADAVKLNELAQKYPEFGNWVNNLRTIESKGLLPSMSRTRGYHGMEPDSWFSVKEGTEPYITTLYDKGPVAYGANFVPSKSILKTAFFDKANVPEQYGKTLLELAGALGKPVVVNKFAKAHDKQDNSFEAISAKYDKLYEQKPEAVDNALNWKFDPDLPTNKQLTATEREIVNQYRDALRKRSLGEE